MSVGAGEVWPEGEEGAVGAVATAQAGGWDHVEGDDGEDHLDYGLDVPPLPSPGGLVALARRDIGDDKAYAAHPDVVLMREERVQADIAAEAAVVVNVLGRAAP